MKYKLVLIFAFILTIFTTTGMAAADNPSEGLESVHEQHRGAHMHITATPEIGDGRFYEMFLTDQKRWNDSDKVDQPLSEYDSALKITEPGNTSAWLNIEYERGSYNLSTGSIIENRTDKKLRDMVYGSKSNEFLQGKTDSDDVETDGDFGSNENCYYNSCWVLDRYFGNTEDRTNDNLDGLVPIEDRITIHDNANYYPQGEVIKAYEPDTENSTDNLDGSGPYFYVCREGSDEMIVDADGGDTESGLYKCLTNDHDDVDANRDNKWAPTSACNDGLDNDGDGQVDQNPENYDNTDITADDACESQADNSENSSSGEIAPEIKEDTSSYIGDKEAEGLVALYNWIENDDSESGYSELDEIPSARSPVTYLCNENGNIEEYTAPISEYSEDMRKDAKHDCQQFTEERFEEVGSKYHGDPDNDDTLEVPSAQYMIPSQIADNDARFDETELIDGVGDYANTGEPEDESNNHKGMENWEEQTLHEAELEYWAEQEVLTENVPHTEDPHRINDIGQAVYYSGVHNEDSWTSQRLPDSFIEGYIDHTEDDTDTADGTTIEELSLNAQPGWTTSNPTTSNQETDLIKGEFPGGFIPECKSTSIWSPPFAECTYPQSEIDLQFYKLTLPVDEDSLETNYIGVQLNHSELQKWNDVYPTDSYEGGSSSRPVQIRTQCWVGKNSRPANENSINMRAPLDLGGDKKAVAFQAPTRDDDSINKKSYSCIWGFTQEVTDYKTQFHALELFHVSDGEAEKVQEKDQYLQDNSAYIIEGVNAQGSIQSEQVGTVLPGDETNGTDQQEWLKGNSIITQEGGTASTTETLWPMFPEGVSGPGVEDQNNRNPGAAFSQ